MASNSINIKNTVQVLTLDKDALKFCVPFALSISGPSQSGKTRQIQEFHYQWFNT